MTAQPTGTVTLLFSDIEGSTRLLEHLGTERYAEVLELHRELLREAFRVHDGYEVGTEGDSFFVAFHRPEDAVAAAEHAQHALAGAEWPDDTAIRVRMGLHTGTPGESDGGYVGMDVHRAARIMAAAHGGQVVVSAATRALIDGSGLTELGEHRLKDFDEPVGLFQLGSQRFGPLKTISNTNLPRPASSLVGRERERDELVAMLQNGSRLVTLTGPGGSGKTRLALEVASDLVPAYAGGVFWSDLSPLREPALVTATLAETLVAKGGLAEHIGDRELLLVLDNFEQVAEAAPQLGDLLRSCSRLRALVTSREVLRIGGEVEYPVHPLADTDAVELFSTRSSLEPDETMAELCRRLDNMPLAIELAAARTRVLTPAQILERLGQRLDLLKGGRDTDPRQQTLRATIQWSHDLLDDEERRLFARLAVFAGGCTLEAAEQVVDADIDVLQSLLDKSLLRRTGERFWMLETIRDYAHEQLIASGEEEHVRRRHAMAVLDFVESTTAAYIHADMAAVFRRAAAEHDNTRAALEWARDVYEHDVLLRLVASVSPSWSRLGRSAEELQQWQELALERYGEPVELRGWVLVFLASTLSLRGDGRRAAELVAEARGVAGEVNDQSLLFEIMSTSAWLAFDKGDLDSAREEFAALAERAHERDDVETFAKATTNLAGMLAAAGAYEAALESEKRARDAFRTTGDEGGVANTFAGEAWCALALTDAKHAAGSFLEAVDVMDRLGFRPRLADAATGLGCSLIGLHATKEGIRLLAAAAAATAELGRVLEEPWPALRDDAVASARQALDDEAFAAAWAEGEAMPLEQAIAAARAAALDILPMPPA